MGMSGYYKDIFKKAGILTEGRDVSSLTQAEREDIEDKIKYAVKEDIEDKFKYTAKNDYEKEYGVYKEQQRLDEIKRQREESEAKHKAEIERIQQAQQELARKQEEARLEAERTKREREYKAALDAMNQRARFPERETSLLDDDGDVEIRRNRDRKRVGYDATRLTSVLGVAKTEKRDLLGG